MPLPKCLELVIVFVRRARRWELEICKFEFRTARYGKQAGREFFGCSGYPNCKYVKNIE